MKLDRFAIWIRDSARTRPLIKKQAPTGKLRRLTGDGAAMAGLHDQNQIMFAPQRRGELARDMPVQ